MSVHPGETTTLRAAFAERAISLRTMEHRLRALTALAVLAIAAAAALIALRDLGWSTLPLDAEEHLPSTIPKVSFWLVVTLVALAWSYVLGGLAHADRLVRVGALGAFTWTAYELWDVGLGFATWRMAPSYVLLAAVWLVVLGARRDRDRRSLQLGLVALLFVLLLALDLAFWWRLLPYHDPRFFSLAFYHRLEQLSFALIPLLLVAGVDFAEWGDVAAGRLAASVPALPVLAAGAAAGILAYRVAVTGAADLGRGIGLAAAFAALAAVPVLAGRRAHAHVPYAAIVASSLMLMGIVLGISYSVTRPSSETPRLALVSHAPRFRLDYPLGWQAQRLPGKGPLAIFLLVAPSEAGQLYVVYLPPSLARGVRDPLAAIFKGVPVSTGRDGPWRETHFRALHGNRGDAWQRSVGGATWLLAGVAAPVFFAALDGAFHDIVSSWTTTLRALPSRAPRYTAADRAIEGASIGWLAVAVAASALLVALRRRRTSGWVVPSLAFAVVAGWYWVLVQLPTIGYTLFGAASRGAWPGLTMRGLEAFVGAATLVGLLTRPGRNAAAPLLALNLGLFVVYWLERAISSGVGAAGRLSIVAAVLVLVALGWDILMSGEAITNRHTARYPRESRVLAYLGYVIAVAAAVLFFSSIHTGAGSVEPLFESENFSDTGLLFLGTSLVVALFLLRLRDRHGAPEHAAVELAAEDQPEG